MEEEGLHTLNREGLFTMDLGPTDAHTTRYTAQPPLLRGEPGILVVHANTV
jgi:hypothetical protein